MNLVEAVVEKWRHQHLTRPDWAEHYWSTQDLPSRRLVCEALAWLQPWRTLAELGCNAGPMLAAIRARYPQAQPIGVEPNLVAANACRKNLEDQVPVVHESLQEWLQGTAGVDALVTHYTLAYISPEELRPVLADMCRVAKRGLVIAEPMGPDELIWAFPEWRHDYLGTLVSLGISDFWVQTVEGVGHLNGVLGARW